MTHLTTTRRQLLTLAAYTSPAARSDTDRLIRLAAVEQLILYCYDQVIVEPVVGPKAQHAVMPMRAHEQAHVRALEEQIRARGARMPPPPAGNDEANAHLAKRKVGGRLGQLRGAKDALRLLLSVERVVIGAYFVALIKLNDPHLIELAAQIMASDAQHEALINAQLYPGKIPSQVPYALVQGVQ